MKYAIQMILVIALLSSLGCSAQPVTNHIGIPDLPELPILTPKEQAILVKNPPMLEVLNDRETILIEYIRNLRGRIEKNNRRSK